TFTLASPAYTAGDHIVIISVIDDDGGIGTRSFHVLVGARPVITPAGNQTIAKNTLLSGGFSFTGTPNSGYTFSINWSDPSGTGNVQAGSTTTDGAGSGGFSGSHTYSHKGTYTVFVTVTDALTGISDTMPFQVTVN